MDDASGPNDETWDVSQDAPNNSIVVSLRELTEGEHSRFLDALRTLADGSRHEDRREAYGSTGLLDYAMELQATTTDLYVRRESLRIIANACADTGKEGVVLPKVSSSSAFC